MSTEKEPLSIDTIIKSMHKKDQKYASKILSHIPSSLWDSNGKLISLDLTVQDLIKMLKNSVQRPIGKTLQTKIRHFLYKHTSIEPASVFKSEYMLRGHNHKPRGGVKLAKTQWLDHQ